jgi:hypothetical protein
VKEDIEENAQAEEEAQAAPEPPLAATPATRRLRSLIQPRFGWLLVLVLLIGFVLRIWGIDWDQYTHLHPDERFLTMVETDMQIPHSLGQYFDSATSPLNPYNTKTAQTNFAYGTMPMFLTKISGEVLQHQDFFPLNLVKDGLEKAFGGPGVSVWNDYAHIDLVGRLLSTLADTATILVVFMTGKLLYDRRAGLLAAALLSVSVLNIQLAHFFAVDSFLTLFAALTIYYCIRVVKFGGWGNFALAGVAYGFAASCKLNGAFLGAPIALATAIRLWRPTLAALGIGHRTAPEGETEAPASPDLGALVVPALGIGDRTAPEGEEERAEAHDRLDLGALVVPALGFLLAIFAAFIVYRIANPYAFTGPFW